MQNVKCLACAIPKMLAKVLSQRHSTGAKAMVNCFESLESTVEETEGLSFSF